MNIKSIASAAMAALMTFALAAPATVLAGDRHNGHHGGHHSSHQSDRHGGHHKKHFKHHKRHFRNRHHGDGRHSSNHHNRHHGNDSDDLLIGLLIGGILGYAANESSRYDDITYNRYDRYPQTPTHRATETYRYNGSSCRQEREYQTTVIVGGREMEAYGTACLQPDGSWRRGPAELAAY